MGVKSSILCRIRIMYISLRFNIYFCLEVYPGTPVWTFTLFTSMPEAEILSIFPPVSVYSLSSHPCFSSPIRSFINPFTDKRKGDLRHHCLHLPVEHTHSNWSQGRHAVSGFKKHISKDLFILGLGLICAFIICSHIFWNYLYSLFVCRNDKISIFYDAEWLYHRHIFSKEKLKVINIFLNT